MEPVSFTFAKIHPTSALQKSSLAEVGANKTENQPAASFSQALNSAVDHVDSLQKKAEVSVENVALGKPQDMHRVMLSIHKADIGLKLAVEVRNKAVEAYQEIMRMPV